MPSEFSHLHPLMLDDMGRFRTTSLFWEENRHDRKTSAKNILPFFTTKAFPHTVDGVTYPSLKAVYLSYEHIPGFEYEFALDVFGSWDHWTRLTQSSMRDMFQGWRDELTVKLKSKAIKNIMTAAVQDTAIGINAARYLADEGYVPKKVGRITKEEKAREVKIAANVKENLQEDMARLGLQVVK